MRDQQVRQRGMDAAEADRIMAIIDELTTEDEGDNTDGGRNA